MAKRQEVTFEFPDPDKDDGMEIEGAVGATDPFAKAKTDDAEKLDIEVVDDTPAKDRNKKPAPLPDEVSEDELTQYSDKVKKRIAHLDRSRHDERRAKEQALREREELEAYTRSVLEENKALKGSVNKSQTAVVAQVKQSAQLELDAAKKRYAEAHEAGITADIVAAQDDMMNAKIKLDRVNNVRIAPLQDETVPVKTPQNSQQPQPTPKPVVDERANQWAKDNAGWFGTDDEMTAYALGLSSKLIKEEKLDPQSDAYYNRLNTRLRQVFPDEFDEPDDETDKPSPTPKAKTTTVATVSRSTAPRKIRLTATAVATAKKLGVPLEEYARQVAALQRTQ